MQLETSISSWQMCVLVLILCAVCSKVPAIKSEQSQMGILLVAKIFLPILKFKFYSSEKFISPVIKTEEKMLRGNWWAATDNKDFAKEKLQFHFSILPIWGERIDTCITSSPRMIWISNMNYLSSLSIKNIL